MPLDNYLVYWNNPTIQIAWPADRDPIAESSHGGRHCLFFDPAVPIVHVQPQQTLTQLCEQANLRLAQSGRSSFVADQSAHDWMANLVKINMMVANLQEKGCVKPMLLAYHGALPFVPGTGDSRLKAMTRISGMTRVPAFISTSSAYRQEFSHLVCVDSLEKFAEICGARPGTGFWFRLTDDKASYGLDWYEYSNELISLPSTDWCVTVLQRYIDLQSNDFAFDPAWFDQAQDWSAYS
jgi:hypothetical protein